jgi:Ran GTPase-activating protein (RanGAP) involved in mRNA processing and transport
MEFITTVFSQFRTDMNEKLNAAERQILYLLKSQDSTVAVKNLEARIALLEARGVPSVFETPAPQIRSGGLEGLLMKRESMPSPILSPIAANSVIVPTIQRQHTVVLEEKPMTVLDSLARARVLEAAASKAEEEVDDEVAYGEVVAAQGGLDDEEEEVEEEEVEEEEVEEEEEAEEEALELAEFPWKGKTYYKDQHNKVYRIIDDAPEDEPFAEYDEANQKLVKIA